MTRFDLAISVTSADGRVTRWGPDAPNGQDVPNDLTFSTSIPGGFKDLTTSLLRRIDRTYSDEALFDDVRVYTAGGGSTAWEGRMAQLPRQHGQSFGVTPGAVGWAAHLRDDPSFREVYRDMDLTRWEPSGVARRRANLTSARTLAGDPQIRKDSTSSALVLAMGPYPNPTPNPISEAWYDAKGLPISSLYYAWRRGVNLDNTNVNWRWGVRLSSDDAGTSIDSSANLRAAGPGTGTFTATTATRVYAYVLMLYGTNTGLGNTQDLEWQNLAVYGNHGLTLRGTEPNAGFYVSDLVDNVVARAAPLLSRDGIEQNTSVIPHAVFLDPVTAEDAVSQLNAYALWEWGVWEDRDFFYRAPDLDRTQWRCRLTDGARVDLEGDTAEQIYNGVYVTYTDAVGDRKTVGPPGSTADDTDSALEDTSSDNPVNAHGIPRRWARLDLSVPTTLSGATLIGQAYLAERSLASKRGTIQLTGTAIHPTKGVRPVWEIRAGDSILIEDRVGDTPRRIIETSYRHADRSISLSCDNTSAKVDAILERLGVNLIGGF